MTGVTVIDTCSSSCRPSSSTRNRSESDPWAFASGVYTTRFPLTAPSEPRVGCMTMEYVRMSPSTSVAGSTIVVGVSSAVVSAASLSATGASLTGVTSTKTVPIDSTPSSSSIVYRN